MTPIEIYVLVFSPICAVAIVLAPLLFAARDVVRGARSRDAVHVRTAGREARAVQRRFEPPHRRRTAT